MFVADGGGGGTSSAPSYAGQQTLAIDFDAIPAARKAFQTALDRVEAKVKQLGGLEVPAWAGDSVSSETANRFAQRSNGGGGESAIHCLTGYRDQLLNVIRSLDAAQNGYVNTESGNSARMNSGN
ncbi:MAG TPA: hypothetical protein VFV67_25910 [Actinophytocola sp.]|uniref:hypothetical protein n=1 Tax=Actinophytocola sp. TaxID=1872138 RepID=UPI002DB88B72|nr:hypothetical protein [Actinophytocola sp.]HEU5474096.1 hypothetical protein [Actinophytocola sp.]